jgi:hypothetical protein
MSMEETEHTEMALVPLTEALPELCAADYENVRSWHDARLGLRDGYETEDGKYLKFIRDTLTSGTNLGSGLWTEYLSYCGLPERMARERIQKMEGRFTKRVAAASAAVRLPEPASAVEEPTAAEEEPAPAAPPIGEATEEGLEDEEQEEQEDEEYFAGDGDGRYWPLALGLTRMMDEVVRAERLDPGFEEGAPHARISREAFLDSRFLESATRDMWEQTLAAVRLFDEIDVPKFFACVREYGADKQLPSERRYAAQHKRYVREAYDEAVQLVGSASDQVADVQWLIAEAKLQGGRATRHLARLKAGEESVAEAVRRARARPAKKSPPKA